MAVTNHSGAAQRLLNWLDKGRRCDLTIAKRNWGMSPTQYRRTIHYLKECGYTIDSDEKRVKRPVKGHAKAQMRVIASHQLIRSR